MRIQVMQGRASLYSVVIAVTCIFLLQCSKSGSSSKPISIDVRKVVIEPQSYAGQICESVVSNRGGMINEGNEIGLVHVAPIGTDNAIAFVANRELTEKASKMFIASYERNTVVIRYQIPAANEKLSQEGALGTLLDIRFPE